MKKHTIHFVVFSLLLMGQTSQAQEFKIEFEWDPDMKSCFSTFSPEIKLFNVPEGTTKLKIVMKDRQSSYRHGGGKFAYNGEAAIPAGTLKYWEGPCPPNEHTYTFSVTAKGGKKKAKASYSQNYKQP